MRKFFSNTHYALPLLWLVPLSIFIAILWQRPHWGLMDDAFHVHVWIPAMLKNGIWKESWDFIHHDLGWGMLRAFYPSLVFVLYLPGFWWGATATFLLNALASLVIVYVLVRRLSTIVGTNWIDALWVCAGFFYLHDLLQHPSLQEKLVLLASFLVLGFLQKGKELGPWALVGLGLALCFGAFTKASFAIHAPVALMVYWGAAQRDLLQRNRKAWALFAALALYLLVLVLGYKLISQAGFYTNSRYSAAKILPNLFSREGALFAIPLLLAFFYALRHPRLFWQNPALLAPSIGVLAFLVVFLPWGIKAYIQTVIAPVYACLLVQLLHWYQLNRWRGYWLPLLCAFGLFITDYRSYAMFVRLADLRRFVAAAPALEARGVQEIWMPCEEGRDAMEIYLRSQHSQIAVKRAEDENWNGKSVFYDRALCPLPDQASLPIGCNAEDILFAPSWQKSFRLVKLQCR